MATRDILNHLNEKIGEMSEPEGVTWSEEEWAAKLSVFSQQPQSQSKIYSEALARNIQERKSYTDGMLDRLKKRNMTLTPSPINIAQGLWLHHRLRAMPVTFMHPVLTGGETVEMILDLLNLAIPGDVEVACIALQNVTAFDDMTKPYHFWDSTVRDWIVADMKSYLGWP